MIFIYLFVYLLLFIYYTGHLFSLYVGYIILFIQLIVKLRECKFI